MSTPPAPWPLATFRAFRDRPRLVSSLAVGAAVGVVLYGLPNALRDSTRNILIWDSTGLTFSLLMIGMMCDCGIDRIQARAAAQDEGRGLTLVLSVLAASLSVVAIAQELSLAKGDHEPVKALRVGLAFLTIVVSWFFTHLNFALHYAHEYYSPETCEDQEGRTDRGGLNFPGGEPPDYWDFLHFSLIIGVANQTADIQISSRKLRSLATLHSLVAWFFNAVILALTVNLAATLF